MKTFNFYSDGGHGWLKISINDLKKFTTMKTINNISRYSYIRNNHVYLEEDCDMSLFITENPTSKIKYHHSNKSSRIRNYESFSVSML